MSFESVFPELFQMDTETIDGNKILHELLNNTNIETKTHILSPIEMAVFDAFIEDLNSAVQGTVKLKRTSKFLKTFRKMFLQYMVSWKRQSRIEVTNTLANAREQQNPASYFQKLLGMNKPKEV